MLRKETLLKLYRPYPRINKRQFILRSELEGKNLISGLCHFVRYIRVVLHANLAIILAVGCMIVFCALVVRDMSMYAFMTPDALTHSRNARLGSVADSGIAYYLYILVYRFTNFFSSSFLDCAKLFNAVFFVLGAPIIYWIARNVTDVLTACLIALVAIAAPINIFTSQFTTEAMFYCFFWIFIALALRLDNDAPKSSWIFAGVGYAACTLVRPQALLFLPALLLYFTWLLFYSERSGFRVLLRKTSLFLLTAITMKLAVGLILAGRRGLSFFGTKYESMVTKVGTDSINFVNTFSLILTSLEGHILSTSILFGGGLVLMLLAVRAALPRQERVLAEQKIVLLLSFVLANLIGVTALFSATSLWVSPFESIYRLHVRYYDFVFPAFFITAAAQDKLFGNMNKLKIHILSVGLALMVAMPVIYAYRTGLKPYIPLIADCPELFILTLKSNIFQFSFYLTMLSLLLSGIAPRFGGKAFLYLIAPINTVLLGYSLSKDAVAIYESKTVYDRAGEFARNYIPKEDLSYLVTISGDSAVMWRPLFYLDSKESQAVGLAEGSTIDQSKLPRNTKWILAIGRYKPPGLGFSEIKKEGFTLFHRMKVSDS